MKPLKLAIALIAAALPLSALAHADLKSSTPAKGSTVQSSPSEVVLVFGEAVELKALSVMKKGESKPTQLGPLPTAFAERQAVPLPKLGDGEYTISYTYEGSDTHVMTATIPFKVSAAAKPAAGKAAAAPAHDEHAAHSSSEHKH